MLAIVMVIVGIALAAALIYGDVSVLQTTSPARERAKNTMTTSIYGLASAYQAYVSANGTSPPTNVACKATELVPTYISEIKYPTPGMACAFGTNATYGDYFCYSGSVEQSVYNGFSDASVNFPNNTSSYIIGTSGCGERTTDTAPTTWPASVYVTYWLEGQ